MEAVHVVFRFRGGEGKTEFAPVRLTDKQVIIDGQKNPFNLDAVIDPYKSQAEAYDVCGRHVVNQFMTGFNGTIFAYGQSGSGKTFTMMGPESVTEALMQDESQIPPEVQASFGVIPRAVAHMFETINQGIQREQITYTLVASYIEIYNEKVNDIMSCPIQKDLKIRELPNLGPTVMGIKQQPIVAPEEVFQCIAMGTANKQVASTNQNSRSSRSHTLFLLDLEQKYLTGTVKKSRINLVDLAGSEKISKTGAEGQTLEEAKKINLSLTTLGRVIKALTDPKEKFVPYRESKLTIILKESLGGNSKTSLICTASMKGVHIEETINTLRFAERAKMIVCKVKSNVQRSPAELEKIIEELKKEITTLKKKMVEGGQLVMGSEEDENAKQQYIELKTEYENYKNSSIIQIEQLKDELERVSKGTNNLEMSTLQEKYELLEEEFDGQKQKMAILEVEKQNIIQEKEVKLKELQDENGELKIIVDQVVKDCENVDKQKQECQLQLQKAEGKIVEFKLQVELLTKEKQQAEKKISNFDEERNNIKQDLNRAKNELNKLSQECEFMSSELDQTKKRLQDVQGDLKASKDEQWKSDEEIKKLKSQLEKLKTENDKITHQHEDQIAKNEELKQQNEKIDQYLKNEVAKTSSLTSQVNLVEEEITNLKKLLTEKAGQQEILKEKDDFISKLKINNQNQIDEKNAMIEDLNRKLKAIQEQELFKTKEQQEKLQIQITQFNQELTGLKEKLNGSESELYEVKRKNKDQDDQIKKYQEMNDALKIESRKQVQEIQAELSKLKNQSSDLQADNERLKKELKEFEQTHKKEYSLAKEQAMEANKKIITLQGRIQSQKEDADRMEKNFQQEMNLKTHALQAAERQANTQTEKAYELELKLAQATADMNKLRQQLQTLMKQNEIQRRETLATRMMGNKKNAKTMGGIGMGKTIQSQVKSVFGVNLKKTQNKYLQAALQESNKFQEEDQEQESPAKFKNSKASNKEQEQVEKQESEESSEEEKSGEQKTIEVEEESSSDSSEEDSSSNESDSSSDN